MDAGATFSENLQRLYRFFTRAGEFGYAFAVASDERIIPEINEHLQAKAREQERTLQVLALQSQAGPSLMAQLNAASQSADGLLITGISTFLNQRGKEALFNFNFSRESIQQLGIPLLFWIDAQHLSHLSRQAADLYSQRRLSTLFFEKALDTLAVETRLSTRFPEAFKSSQEYERLTYRLALLQEQYEEAKGQSSSRLLEGYLFPLAQAYSKLDLHQEVWQLLEPEAQALLDRTEPDFLVQFGDLLFAAKKYALAEQAYTKALALLPDTHLPKRSYLLTRLGDLQKELGRMAEAQGHYEASLALNQQRVLEDQAANNDLAISYERLASILKAQGQFEQALEFFQKRTQLGEQLFQANPHSESLKNGLAISYSKMGDILKAQGQFEQALEFFQKRTQLGEQLFHANPHSESLKNGLAISYSKMGDILQAQGQFEQALEFFQKRTQLGEQLFQANPHSFELHRGLGISYYKLAEVAEAGGKSAVAKGYYQQTRDIFQQLWEQTKIPQLQQWVGIVDGKLKELG
jgi:tetratricopeptide (TPR) repeat protein